MSAVLIAGGATGIGRAALDMFLAEGRGCSWRTLMRHGERRHAASPAPGGQCSTTRTWGVPMLRRSCFGLPRCVRLHRHAPDQCCGAPSGSACGMDRSRLGAIAGGQPDSALLPGSGCGPGAPGIVQRQHHPDLVDRRVARPCPDARLSRDENRTPRFDPVAG
jgi:hypothetical protein